MPHPLLNAYAEGLPRLTASDALLASETTAVGAGRLRRGERQRILRGWMRLTKQDQPTLRAHSRGEYRAHMAISGIAVRQVPMKADDG